MIVMLETREVAIEQFHRQQVVDDGLFIGAGFFAGHHQWNTRRIRDDLHGYGAIDHVSHGDLLNVAFHQPGIGGSRRSDRVWQQGVGRIHVA
ncbi:hypothetical protein D3C86_1405140 [compost metagenome]